MTRISRRTRRLRLLGAAAIAGLLLTDIAAYAQSRPAPPPGGQQGKPPHGNQQHPPAGGGAHRPPQNSPGRPPGGGNVHRPPTGGGHAQPRPPSGGGYQHHPPQTQPHPPANRPPVHHPPGNAHRPPAPPAYHRPGAGRPPNLRPIHRPPYVYPHGYGYRRWITGGIIPRAFMASPYYFYDWTLLGVGPPPSGYVWVRYGPDLLLVRMRDREVVDVIYGAFY